MMKDLDPKSSWIDKEMARKKRKQIPLCRKCHMEHHAIRNKNHKCAI
jgi:hypothetical protein